MPRPTSNVVQLPAPAPLPKRRTARVKLTDAAVRDFPLQGQDPLYGPEERLPAILHDEEVRGFFLMARIGSLALDSGCYSVAEVFRLAAEDLAHRGLADGAAEALRARVTTVRSFLAEKYGCPLGPRAYFTPSHRTPDEQDAWEFLKVLARAVRTERRAA